MRESRVLSKLRAGKTVSCYNTALTCPRSAEIAGMYGFDCLWTCLEHRPTDISVIEKQIWAAKAHNMDTVVRVPRGSYSDYIRPMEADAAGIMVPHVMSLEDAKNVVRTVRFHPVGRRPVDGGNADGSYTNVPFVEYIKQANEQRFVIVQIEDPEPLDELDEICALDGIDIIFFGPGDFSHSIGFPGQWYHPRIIEARKLVAETAIRHGKWAGTVASPGNLNEILDLGYRFIAIGADVVGLSQYCKSLMSVFPTD